MKQSEEFKVVKILPHPTNLSSLIIFGLIFKGLWSYLVEISNLLR